MKNIFAVFVLLTSGYSLADTICQDDSRTTATNHRIGRLTFKNSPACTITLIGKECALSAGHCAEFMAAGIVEFDVPLSQGSAIRNSDPKNTYQVDSSTIQFQNNDFGLDWSVFKLKPNAITKALAGSVNGYYPISLSSVNEGTLIQVAGFGLDDREFLNTNGTLQLAFGKITEISESQNGDGSSAVVLNHNVDTTEGDSGAVIVRLKEQDIIGIHTHGGQRCGIDDNKGTLISDNRKLQDAIKNCLR